MVVLMGCMTRIREVCGQTKLRFNFRLGHKHHGSRDGGVRIVTPYLSKPAMEQIGCGLIRQAPIVPKAHCLEVYEASCREHKRACCKAELGSLGWLISMTLCITDLLSKSTLKAA